MDKLQERANRLRKELAEVETEIAFVQPKVQSVREIGYTLADMSDSRKWKDFVTKEYGVVYNICTMVDDSYNYLAGEILGSFGKDPVLVIGHKTDGLWSSVKLETIKRLISPTKMKEDYSDTANGCDEIVDREMWKVVADFASNA